ncbi:MAG: hypothetical protein K9J12_14925 [Melioribacteraceae bacterium]|nr:hypothetical protein [Melioribacteraceae bacterium]MCF8265413.1 hypothetical protein [Melioribacteraceae bacterium]MCF8432265.1 hypothetical protein [Melioribacteraceae bacterium]
MIRVVTILFATFLCFSCQNFPDTNNVKVNNHQELRDAIDLAEPGQEIILANGVWKDLEIRFEANGTEKKPITLKAETNGKVFIEGKSSLKLGGSFLIVEGLFFRNGYSSSETLIEFRIDADNIANNCVVKECVILDFNQPNRYNPDHWVEFWGRHNELSNCYIAGKSNQGPTIRVNLGGNEHVYNYHKIVKNHFGPRPRKGGPKAETLQIGDSGTSMTPSYLLVADNLFEKCNGEVEVISSKSNFNEFRNNIFYGCEGSLVLRHGNYCTVDGNFFIGSDENNFTGGIRVINTGHWITNNYFYKIKGAEFRSPLAIMNGIPKSPLNRYNQVTDVVVAYNTWIDCKSPWQFSVGANNDKVDVLPPSEIRSARPERTIVANNIIYNSVADETPVKNYDKVDGITFKSNIINNQDSPFMKFDGVRQSDIEPQKINDWLFTFTKLENESLDQTYSGFDFGKIEKDIFGNKRKKNNLIGAVSGNFNKGDFEIDYNKFGASWFESRQPATTPALISVGNVEDLISQIASANSGDVIELEAGNYTLNSPLKIDKKLTIRSKDELNNPTLNFNIERNESAFEINPAANLTLSHLLISGQGSGNLFSTLEKNMSSNYKIFVVNSQLKNFDQVLKSYRGSMADTLMFENSELVNFEKGIVLAAETDDKGDYNAAVVKISGSSFSKINSDVINYYRGGYDESTIGGILEITGSEFTNCGMNEKSGILLKTRGIINVEISNNSFVDNPVKLVALLWGEKDNTEIGNQIKNSGVIRTEQFLKQKLVY